MSIIITTIGTNPSSSLTKIIKTDPKSGFILAKKKIKEMSLTYKRKTVTKLWLCTFGESLCAASEVSIFCYFSHLWAFSAAEFDNWSGYFPLYLHLYRFVLFFCSCICDCIQSIYSCIYICDCIQSIYICVCIWTTVTAAMHLIGYLSQVSHCRPIVSFIISSSIYWQWCLFPSLYFSII